jgi:hypothetical protein
MKKLVEKLNKEREEEKEREVLAVLEEKAYKDALKDYKKQEELDKLTEFHKKQYGFYIIIIIIQWDYNIELCFFLIQNILLKLSIDCFIESINSH